VLDIGENEKVIGIEILNASKNININLERLLPARYEATKRVV